ncbi:MAG: hypothetical protein AAF939_17785 [Planctomycetota bacterium]
MDDETQEQDFQILEELTAYLDGELSQEEVDRIERRLGEDPDYRAEMKSLQATWDVLDALPATEPGNSFTKTTMEIIVGDAVKRSQKKASSLRYLPRAAVLILIPVILFGFAFNRIRQNQTLPDRQLIQNLTTIKYHNQYTQLGNQDLDFLIQLIDSQLFDLDPIFENEIAESDPPQIPSELNQRRDYIESLDIEEKLELQDNLALFEALNERERKARIQFDQKIQNHAQKNELLSVMKAYSDWLFRYSNENKNQSEVLEFLQFLNDASSNQEKVAAIKKLKDDQASRKFLTDSKSLSGAYGQWLPSGNDAERVFQWYEDLVEDHSQEIRDLFPVAIRKYEKRVGKSPASQIRLNMMVRRKPIPVMFAFLLAKNRGEMLELFLNDAEVELFLPILSSESQRQFASMSLDRQKNVLMDWIEAANKSKLEASFDRLSSLESSLTKSERDRLTSLSTEEYRKRLMLLYRGRYNTKDPVEEIDEILEEWGESSNRLGFRPRRFNN